MPQILTGATALILGEFHIFRAQAPEGSWGLESANVRAGLVSTWIPLWLWLSGYVCHCDAEDGGRSRINCLNVSSIFIATAHCSDNMSTIVDPILINSDSPKVIIEFGQCANVLSIQVAWFQSLTFLFRPIEPRTLKIDNNFNGTIQPGHNLGAIRAIHIGFVNPAALIVCVVHFPTEIKALSILPKKHEGIEIYEIYPWAGSEASPVQTPIPNASTVVQLLPSGLQITNSSRP